MIRIGSAEIPSNVLLAPLAGCSDLPFRLIARECGAKFCFFEMVDVNSLLQRRRQAKGILKTNENDRPIAAQLLGNNPDQMLEAAEILLGVVNVSFLDINSACPAKKVIKKRAGAYLVKEPEPLYAMLKLLTSRLHLPVTIKMRTGFDVPDIERTVTFARRCEESGASCIFVHGRTRAQKYAGEIDYASIRAIKNSVSIPVIGSGNILSAQLARRMFSETGCDGILVARGALGNPWIFRYIDDHERDGSTAWRAGIDTRKTTLKRHLDYITRYKECSDEGKFGFMRKVAVWYTKGFPHAAHIRSSLFATRSYEELVRLIDSIEAAGEESPAVSPPPDSGVSCS